VPLLPLPQAVPFPGIPTQAAPRSSPAIPVEVQLHLIHRGVRALHTLHPAGPHLDTAHLQVILLPREAIPAEVHLVTHRVPGAHIRVLPGPALPGIQLLPEVIPARGVHLHRDTQRRRAVLPALLLEAGYLLPAAADLRHL